MHATIEALYGTEAPTQRARYQRALEQFYALYGPGEARIYRAPGRVNLIGEHTDYNHGFVFPLALDRDTLLIARPRREPVVRLGNVEAAYAPTEFTIGETLQPAQRGHWSNYARGPAQLMAQRAAELGLTTPLRGLDGLVDGAEPFGVPRGAGVSSSSALTVAAAVALADTNGWEPDDADLARFCSTAEWYVGTRGGVMDHFASILSRQSHALFLDCRPAVDGAYATRRVLMPAGYRLMVVDSGVHHDNARGEFNLRVAACRAGVALLRDGYPGITHLRDVQKVTWPELEPLLPERITVRDLNEQGYDLGDLPGLEEDTSLDVRARCRHVWTENQRVLDAAVALEAGDVLRVGALLSAAHASARDDYGVSCPEVETLIRVACEVDGVLGARLTGAGWGGCIIALTADAAVNEFSRHVRESYLREYGRDPVVFACQAGPGAGRVSGFR